MKKLMLSKNKLHNGVKLMVVASVMVVSLMASSCHGISKKYNNSENDEYYEEEEIDVVEIPSWLCGNWGILIKDERGWPIGTNYIVINQNGTGVWAIMRPDGLFETYVDFSTIFIYEDDGYTVLFLTNDGNEGVQVLVDEKNRAVYTATGQRLSNQPIMRHMI